MGARWHRARLRLAAALVTMGLALSLVPPTLARADTAPGTLRVSQRSTMAAVAWDPVADAMSYVVQRATTADFSDAVTATTTEPAVILTNLAPQTSYQVRVADADADGNPTSDWSQSLNFVTPAQQYPLPAPQVTTVLLATESLSVEWVSAGDGITYEIGIGTDPTDLTIRSTTDHDFTFSGLTKQTTYYVSARSLWPDGSAASDWSAPTQYVTPADEPLRVGSYNVRNGTDKTAPAWSGRRKALAATIAGQNVAVVGLQEATWRNVPGRGISQYGDIARLLGASWKSTTYVGNAGPEGTRILYDSSKVTMLREGYQKLAGTHANHNWRYVTWAEFRQDSTGKRFFFTDTHFLQWKNSKGYKSRASCARQLVAIVKKNNVDDLPTIMVGDFNSHKFRNPDNAPHKIITAAGYLDPLGNVDDWRGDGNRGIAEKRIDENYFTINGFKRTAQKATGYSTGVMLDQIYVTPMRVAEWETVVNVNSAGKFIGTIPSDHNMIRATLYLP